MASATHVPVEVYLRSSYEPDAEYVDGQIEERPAGEYDHACWRTAIVNWFLQHRHEWNIRVLAELRVQVAANRFRVPDVTVLDKSRPKEQIITHAPLAVFEVLFPEDKVQRLFRKLKDYRVMGIPEIWLIDPQDSTCYRCEDGDLRLRNTFSHTGKGISFDMNEIKNLLDD